MSVWLRGSPAEPMARCARGAQGVTGRCSRGSAHGGAGGWGPAHNSRPPKPLDLPSLGLSSSLGPEPLLAPCSLLPIPAIAKQLPCRVLGTRLSSPRFFGHAVNQSEIFHMLERRFNHLLYCTRKIRHSDNVMN